MSFNLLITSAGGVWAPNLIIQIRVMTKHHPIKIHIADILKNVKSEYVADSFNTLPKVNNINYIKEIIKIVKDNPGITQSMISQRLDVSRQKINYHVNSLVANSILNLEKQGRITRLYPTHFT